MNDRTTSSNTIDGREKPARQAFQQRAAVGVALATFGLGSMWVYVCFVFAYGASIGGMEFSTSKVGGLALVGLLLVFAGAKSLLRRWPSGIPKAAVSGLVCTVIMVTVVSVDLAYAIYSNWTQAKDEQVMRADQRREDSHAWHGELFPEHYFPTNRAFWVYKPGVTVQGTTYGELYHPDLLRSATIANSVLEQKKLTYRIGPLGFRDTTPLSSAAILALGDSFAMSFGTDEGQTWTHKLGESLGEPVYNMGISATGPVTQFALLEHLFEVHGDEMKAKMLLWMLFEGNDLENDVEELRSKPKPPGLGALTQGTLLECVTSIPAAVQRSSILWRAMNGTLRGLPSDQDPRGTHLADGVPSHYPLYHSKKWGYRLFNGYDVHRAMQPRGYVTSHPHLPRLRSVFGDMQKLGKRRGFEVIVVLAPSAARLYGGAFEDCPKLSDEPHFLNVLAELAKESGFQVIDLHAAMQPHAKEHLLYYRDDHHWNVRGNALAADLIRAALRR